MKKNRVFVIVLVLFLIIGTISTDAAALSTNPVNQPWNAQTIDGDEPDVRNLSTTFVGAYQIPMMSYSKDGTTKIFQVFRATADVTGNCGPDNSWNCNELIDATLIPGTVSNIITFPIIDTFLVKWVYQAGNKIKGATVERRNNMELVSVSSVDLIDIQKFGSTNASIIGAPSLVPSGNYYKLAVTITDNLSPATYKLVYMYRTTTSNTSCKTSGESLYQCDVIETSITAELGAPSLQIAGDGTLGIAYYKNGEGIKYAYPYDLLFYPVGRPANCGPEDENSNTWRCISIFNEGTIGPIVKLAMGSTNDYRAMVFNFKPTDTDFLYRATYVGSGGDCGLDGTSPSNTYRWDCNDVDAFINDINKTTYSIAYDPWDYPVISYNNQFTGDVAQRLYIAYPDARFGSLLPGWHRYVIDGNDWSNTGPQSAISFSNSGLGFIGYVQPKFSSCSTCIIDNSQDLRVTMQNFGIFLPNVMK